MAAGDDESWRRQLWIGLGALVAVALVIGVVMSVLALGAAKVTGLGESRPTQTAEPSLYVPTEEPTVGVEPYPEPEGAPQESPSSTSGDDSPPTEKAQPISLQAFPRQVSPGARINLTGVYRRGEGASLQVQRFEGGAWVDFPVTASVSGGQFATYITTSRAGNTRFRVVDEDARRTSNVVRVRIG